MLDIDCVVVVVVAITAVPVYSFKAFVADVALSVLLTGQPSL